VCRFFRILQYLVVINEVGLRPPLINTDMNCGKRGGDDDDGDDDGGGIFFIV
jgi:hypothetical protein